MTYLKVKHSVTTYVLNFTHILTMLWLIFGMYEIQSHNTEELLFSVRLTLFPMAFISGSWFIFTLLYSGLIKQNNKIIYFIVLLPQLITYSPLFTDKWFHLAIVYKDYMDPGHTIWGPAMDINFNLSYAYLVLSFVVLLYYAVKTFRHQRAKVLLLAFSPLIPFIINVLGQYKFIPDPGFNITPITFSIMLLVQSVATFRYKAFDQLHHGAIDVYQNTEEALIIVDDQHQVVDLNHSAQKEFTNYIPSQATQDIRNYIRHLEHYTMDPSTLRGILEAIESRKAHHHAILTLSDGDDRRYYDFYMKRIRTQHGKLSGYLLSLKNRTEHSKELLEAEHRRISRDIHDGLSNLVNVVSMNLEYILKKDLPANEVNSCVEVAFTTNNRMRFEIRKILDELVPLDMEKNGLLEALHSLFKRVTGTGIHIDFTPVNITESLNRNLSLGLLLYSTCLEGINNAMYNGQATNISIVITQESDLVRFLLSDDGIGCDSIQPGRGLEGISDRVKAHGGKVIFESEADNGFSIMMEVPFNGNKQNN